MGIGMTCLSAFCMTLLYLGLRFENSRKTKQHLAAPDVPTEELEGEKDPRFRYQL